MLASDVETGNASQFHLANLQRMSVCWGPHLPLRKQRTSHNRHHVVRFPPPQILVVTLENQPLEHWNLQEFVHLLEPGESVAAPN